VGLWAGSTARVRVREYLDSVHRWSGRVHDPDPSGHRRPRRARPGGGRGWPRTV